MITPTDDLNLVSTVLVSPIVKIPDKTGYLLISDKDRVIGIATIFARNKHLVELSVSILKNFKEDKDLHLAVAPELPAYIFKLGFKKIIAFVPEYESMAFLQRAGLKREGILKEAGMHNNRLFNYTILGSRG